MGNYPFYDMTLTDNTFIGEYAYSLDSKGRVNIPAKFRQSLSADSQNTFVITRGLDPCVWVYPLEQWKEIENNLRNLSSVKNIHRTFVRDTARYASPSTYDKQGRIKINPSLISYAGLEKDVLIVGVVNKIEIWNPEIEAEVYKKNMELDPNEFNELSGKIVI